MWGCEDISMLPQSAEPFFMTGHGACSEMAKGGTRSSVMLQPDWELD